MKEIKDHLSHYEERLRANSHGDFPSFEHEVAWMLAEYFQEPYGFWVRNVLYSSLNAGQIKYEFEQIRPKDFSRKQKAKMLMSTMKILVRKRPVV